MKKKKKKSTFEKLKGVLENDIQNTFSGDGQ